MVTQEGLKRRIQYEEMWKGREDNEQGKIKDKRKKKTLMREKRENQSKLQISGRDEDTDGQREGRI